MRPQARNPSHEAPTAAQAEAAAWLARLHGPNRTPEVEAGFRHWLDASPEHRQAFESATELWDQLPTQPISPLPRISRRRDEIGKRRLVISVVLTATAALVLGLFALLRPSSYATGVGEQRELILVDGSRVWLSGHTRIDVDYRSDTREIRLREGEAYFEVSHNPRRPFVVRTGDRRITALGTIFDVRFVAGHTAVTLLEGKVEVASSSTNIRGIAAAAARILAPGERLRIEPNRTEELDRPAVSSVTAWRYGEIMFDRTPLAEAVEELNRDNPMPVVLDSPSIASLRVSGVFHAGDNLEFSRAIAALYGLRVVQVDGQLHLRSSTTP